MTPFKDEKLALQYPIIPLKGLVLLWSGIVLLSSSMVSQASPTATNPSPDPKAVADRYKNLELFQKVLHYVEENYVDEVSNEKLIHGAIKGMLETLDPHSNFLTDEIYRELKADTSGKYGGVGIEITARDDQLIIVAPIEDTPAWRAGIKPGDKILKINGESTKGMTLNEALAKMRGKAGTALNLGLMRKGFKQTQEFKVMREFIKIKAVKYEPLKDGFGYIRLSTFNENSSDEIKKALVELEKGTKKLKGLVFDLRSNPGGLLDQAVEIVSLFSDRGIVVSTNGRRPDQSEVKVVRPGSPRMDFPIAILVNSSTASAAEIVAGALQDHHRALILGTRTFGKGSVQSLIDLGDDLGLKLTIARYYTPSGRSIQEKGVNPDIELDEYDPELLAKARIKSESTREQDLKNHLVGRPIKEEDESSEGDEDESLSGPVRYQPQTDYQVREAVNYLKSFDFFQKSGPTKEGLQSQKGSEKVAPK